MQYRDEMVQSDPTVFQDREKQDAAAKWLEKLTNDRAVEGWDFYPVDSMQVLTTGAASAAERARLERS